MPDATSHTLFVSNSSSSSGGMFPPSRRCIQIKLGGAITTSIDLVGVQCGNRGETSSGSEIRGSHLDVVCIVMVGSSTVLISVPGKYGGC